MPISEHSLCLTTAMLEIIKSSCVGQKSIIFRNQLKTFLLDADT